MIVFEDNELEMAIVTYNRAVFVKQLLEIYKEEFDKRNIAISIYDSSTDDETRTLVRSLNLNSEKKIKYVSVDTEVTVGYKPVFVMRNSSAKYCWIMGDSRYFDLTDLEEKVFPVIKQGKNGFIQLGIPICDDFEEKEFQYANQMLWTCLFSMTCIGFSIYREDVLDAIREKSNIEYCDEYFKNNYGFGWIGYFLTAFGKGMWTTKLIPLKFNTIFPEAKKQVWVKHYCECWVKNFCDLIEHIPEDIYVDKSRMIKSWWNGVMPAGEETLYKARVYGDLGSIYEEYIRNGYWYKVTDNPEVLERIKYYATETHEKINDRFINWSIQNEFLSKELLQLLVDENLDCLYKENSRPIWIYGAGGSGKLLRYVLGMKDIKICGFIDKNAKMIGEIDDYEVVTIEQVNIKEIYIVISLIHYYEEVELLLTSFDMKEREDYLYLVKR